MIETLRVKTRVNLLVNVLIILFLSGCSKSSESPAPTAETPATTNAKVSSFVCTIERFCQNGMNYILGYEKISYADGTSTTTCSKLGGTCSPTFTCPESSPNTLIVSNYGLGSNVSQSISLGTTVSGCNLEKYQSSTATSTKIQQFACSIPLNCPNTMTFTLNYLVETFSTGARTVACSITPGTCFGVSVTCPSTMPYYVSVSQPIGENTLSSSRVGCLNTNY